VASFCTLDQNFLTGKFHNNILTSKNLWGFALSLVFLLQQRYWTNKYEFFPVYVHLLRQHTHCKQYWHLWHSYTMCEHQTKSMAKEQELNGLNALQ